MLFKLQKPEALECNWLDMHTHSAVSILKDCCGFQHRSPSLLMREKTNIWSALILLIWGGAEAKHTRQCLFVKYAGVYVLEMLWRPGGEHHCRATEPCRSARTYSTAIHPKSSITRPVCVQTHVVSNTQAYITRTHMYKHVLTAREGKLSWTNLHVCLYTHHPVLSLLLLSFFLTVMTWTLTYNTCNLCHTHHDSGLSKSFLLQFFYKRLFIKARFIIQKSAWKLDPIGFLQFKHTVVSQFAFFITELWRTRAYL